MDERVLRFRVGVVTLVAAIITGILVFFFAGGESVLGRKYTLYLGFPQAPGVTINTPVRKNGILIGRVTNVELKDEGGVILTVKIDSKVKLWTHEICSIGTSSLLGDAVLEFVPSKEKKPSEEIIPDLSQLNDGIVVGNPLSVLINLEGDLRGAIQAVEGAGDEVSLMAKNLNLVFDDEGGQINRIMMKTETALDSFNMAMDGLNEVVGDPEVRAKIKQSLEQMPIVLAETRQMLANFERVSQRAERNLENLEGFTKPLGERGERLVANMDDSIANLDELLIQMVRFSEALNNRQGSLGKLVYEDDVYLKLSRAADNIEGVTRRLGPIMEDVRVFTDKIARDPRLLGVKGAIDRRPSGAGIKTLPFGRDWNR